MSDPICPEAMNVVVTESALADRDATVTAEGVLARLIDEVRNERADGPYAYNRQHNRHNR